MSKRPVGRPREDFLMTVSEVAAAKEVSGQAVRLAIRRGLLRAEKAGLLWLIRKSELEKWTPIRGRGAPGVKRKKDKPDPKEFVGLWKDKPEDELPKRDR